jgi:hypothetical protein
VAAEDAFVAARVEVAFGDGVAVGFLGPGDALAEDRVGVVDLGDFVAAADVAFAVDEDELAVEVAAVEHLVHGVLEVFADRGWGVATSEGEEKESRSA